MAYAEYNEEIIEVVAQIVPESALGRYEFHSCEYIGDLVEEYELVLKKTEEEKPKEANIVRLEKKNKSGKIKQLEPLNPKE